MNISVELERLAAAFPWETVRIEIHREPQGEIRYSIYLRSNSEIGLLDSVYLDGASLPEIVDRVIKDHSADRDPNLIRDKAIAELQNQIAKLKAATFEFPPYVPNRELAQFVKPTLDI